MVDRPILRLPDANPSVRRLEAPRNVPRVRGPGRLAQGTRFKSTFDRISAAFSDQNPSTILRSDPSGIAPERALVFETAGGIADFARAAREIGLEVFSEAELDEIENIPDGFSAATEGAPLPRTLYATMPTIEVFEKLLSLWRAYQNDEPLPRGSAPWKKVFELLLEIRPWGPTDRLAPKARDVIEDRMPIDDTEEVRLELEIWPTSSATLRSSWRAEVVQRVTSLAGRVISQCSISQIGFVYDAILIGLPASSVREMLDNPAEVNGLAMLQGVQFILPQTLGQTLPDVATGELENHQVHGNLVVDAPIRAALLDGTPVVAHEAIDGGVVIEDMHDLVRLSEVRNRYHATAMASLILRGDLDADGQPLKDSRIVSVPLLIDADDGGTSSPEDRLFVDLVHTTLLRLISSNDPLSHDIFVVNFSVGIRDSCFSGKISSLARLIDWWAAKEGILFIISAGNMGDLPLTGVRATAFEQADESERRQMVRKAIREYTFDRTLLAPAEAINGLTVGAISQDLNGQLPTEQAGIISLEDLEERLPQLTSALGLGLKRAIKPDLLSIGGRIEVRAISMGDDTHLRAIRGQRTGLIVAKPDDGNLQAKKKSRGTSDATALMTRAVLQAAEALTGRDGPYEGQELPRRSLALLTRALAVNAARWTQDARNLYQEEITRLGGSQYSRAKEEVCRHFGYGIVLPDLMRQSPENGVTMVATGSVRKDQAKIFRLPLPNSMSGDRIPRSMRTTIAWFSPVNSSRAQYRLASLSAVAAENIEDDEIDGWGLNLSAQSVCPDANMIKRGSIWSKRLVHNSLSVPRYDENSYIPICVQCRDVSGGGLSPDEDIEFSLAVTLEIEADVLYDIHEEISQQIRLPLRGST